MDELIWKQDALDAFNGNVTISAARNAGRVYTYLKMVTDRIKALPPVQPTIIRCRDCKYSIDVYNDGDCYCKRPSRELVWIGKSWDFFCKAGDKREGEAYDQ